MEFIFEILSELILTGTFEMSKNKKVPKMIRYLLIFIIMLLYLGVTLLIFYTGVLAYQKINVICGVILIILGAVFMTATLVQFKRTYFAKKNKNNCVK